MQEYGPQTNTVHSGDMYVTQGGDITVTGRSMPVPVRKVRVLMLAANPGSTERLAIDEEARQVTERLRLAHDRDVFELITCWAVRPLDLLQYLNQHNPQIVHFSGHGNRAGEVYLSAGDGTDRRVSAARIGELFRTAGEQIRVVVLNACHSAAQAAEIGRHVDHVVGMNASVTDEVATIFAASFYSALGFGRPVPQAFDQAVAVLGMHDPASHTIPQLVSRPNAKERL
ncbi:CHAT domain-containing protein [Dactylosporangium sp. CA-152071]|uniref:CHAT domain-containing protein n=1 Tax=Dactylosporangium sp. CA-152071 TaxID=3239933 RepID=UPI003D90CAB9